MMFHDFLQTSVHGFKYYLSTWAFLETFLLSGHRAGWASLVYVLKKDGIYQYLCHNSSSVQHSLPSNDSLNMTPTFEDVTGNGTFASLGANELTSSCPEQDTVFELCASMYSVVLAPVSLFMAMLHFSKGMRITRIVSIVLLLAGAVSFGVITTDSPWLIFIGYICISSGGLGVLQTNTQISYMFTKFGSTVAGAIGGAYDASGAVILGVKVLAYEHGIPLSTSFLVIGCITIMAFISTFFFLPKHFIRPVLTSGQVYDKEEEIAQPNSDAVNKRMSEKTQLINRTNRRSFSFKEKVSGVSQKPVMKDHIEDPNAHCSEVVPVETISISPSGLPDKTSRSVIIKYIFSPLYILQFIWTGINQLLFLLFLGSVNAWLGHVTHNVEEKVSNFTNFLSIVMLTAPVFSILSGASIDFYEWIQSDSRNRKTKTLYSLAAPSAFTSIIGVILCACIVAEVEEVTYIIAVLSVVYRSSLYTYWGSFIRVIYPTNYFAGLYGVMLVCTGLVSFLQYPLFLWCESSDSGYRQVYTLLGVLTLCTMALPIYLIYTGWKQRHDQTNSSSWIISA